MNRINVYSYPDQDDYDAMQDGPILQGWFDLDKAELIDPDTYWNGHNHVNVHTRREHYHQYLYRTSSGRWVLNSTSNWEGVRPTYEFLTEEQAREWLIVNGSDDLIAKYFAPLEEESGPAPTGRPAIGKPFPMRLEPDVLAEVDRRADDEGVSRAEMIRRLVAAGLAGQGVQAHRAG
jgi:hypothetical protein